MKAPELTLDAALRDAESPRDQARTKAVSNLSAVLLTEAGLTPPCWDAAGHHPRGPEVRAALRHALQDQTPTIRGLAAIGLGDIGDAGSFDTLKAWLELPGDAEETAFPRECAAIALSYLGSSAPPERNDVRDRIREVLTTALGSSHPDVRYQAALGLAEVSDADDLQVEERLVAVVADDDQMQVRTAAVEALSKLEPLGSRTCAVLEGCLDDDGPLGFEAAMALAAARRPSAGPRLSTALFRAPGRDGNGDDDRDRALEALAVLGPAAPPQAAEKALRMTRSWFIPAVTRVRAAYLVARIQGDTTWLDRLAGHRRASVREAVDDARRALAQLAATDR